ncbi:hypothetical protein F4860DRAFT_510835 [Xylaria cubensis]|nr:hypothetical protein F4860DRAFT_510835 [Xylaria cubensis]
MSKQSHPTQPEKEGHHDADDDLKITGHSTVPTADQKILDEIRSYLLNKTWILQPGSNDNYRVSVISPSDKVQTMQHIVCFVDSLNLALHSRHVARMPHAIITANYLSNKDVDAGLQLLSSDGLAAILPACSLTVNDIPPARGIPVWLLGQIFHARYIVTAFYAKDPAHWGLLIYDQHTNIGIVWDSYIPNAEAREDRVRVNFTYMLHMTPNMPSTNIRWLRGAGPEQQLAWTCGYHVMESARAFLHESGLLDWSRSSLYQGIEDKKQQETNMLRNWASWSRKRIGVSTVAPTTT